MQHGLASPPMTATQTALEWPVEPQRLPVRTYSIVKPVKLGHGRLPNITKPRINLEAPKEIPVSGAQGKRNVPT